MTKQIEQVYDLTDSDITVFDSIVLNMGVYEEFKDNKYKEAAARLVKIYMRVNKVNLKTWTERFNLYLER